MQLCSRCQQANYCNRVCQRADYRSHRRICRRIGLLRGGAADERVDGMSSEDEKDNDAGAGESAFSSDDDGDDGKSGRQQPMSGPSANQPTQQPNGLPWPSQSTENVFGHHDSGADSGDLAALMRGLQEAVMAEKAALAKRAQMGGSTATSTGQPPVRSSSARATAAKQAAAAAARMKAGTSRENSPQPAAVKTVKNPKRKSADAVPGWQQSLDRAAVAIDEARRLKAAGLDLVDNGQLAQALQTFAGAIRKLELADPSLLKRRQQQLQVPAVSSGVGLPADLSTLAASRSDDDDDVAPVGRSGDYDIAPYDVSALRGSIHDMRAQLFMEAKQDFPACQEAELAVLCMQHEWAFHQTLGRARLNLGEVTCVT